MAVEPPPPPVGPSGASPRPMGRFAISRNRWGLPETLWRCVAEVVGTWLLVFVSTSVAAAAVVGAHIGLWQVAVVCGLGVTLAIYLTAAVSGAHINPAVTLAFAIFRPREFPRHLLIPYWISQILGGVLAGITTLLLYGSLLRRFEEQQGLSRGEPGSQLSAMMLGEYFPNPAVAGTGEAAALISPWAATAAEAIGTGVLLLVIFALTDRRNTALPVKYLAPAFIGITVALLISMLGPLTQGSFNPARDFGPRLVSLFAGWGDVAIPGPSGGFWAYIAGPLIGGTLGAAAYHFLLRPALPADDGDE